MATKDTLKGDAHTGLGAELVVRYLGKRDYETVYADMQAFTKKRVELKQNSKQHNEKGKVVYDTKPDELWLCEHPSVYTLGLAGKKEHILKATPTPIVQTDRGGQVTWHGEGQLVVYFMYDLNVLSWHVRDLVTHAENIICQLLDPILNQKQLKALPLSKAPGVYVFAKNEVNPTLFNHFGKIASVGFKIRHGFSYHGIAININADLSHFDAINPCGYSGLKMANLSDFVHTDHQIGIEKQSKALVNLAQCTHTKKTSQSA